MNYFCCCLDRPRRSLWVLEEPWRSLRNFPASPPVLPRVPFKSGALVEESQLSAEEWRFFYVLKNIPGFENPGDNRIIPGWEGGCLDPVRKVEGVAGAGEGRAQLEGASQLLQALRPSGSQPEHHLEGAAYVRDAVGRRSRLRGSVVRHSLLGPSARSPAFAFRLLMLWGLPSSKGTKSDHEQDNGAGLQQRQMKERRSMGPAMGQRS